MQRVKYCKYLNINSLYKNNLYYICNKYTIEKSSDLFYIIFYEQVASSFGFFVLFLAVISANFSISWFCRKRQSRSVWNGLGLERQFYGWFGRLHSDDRRWERRLF